MGNKHVKRILVTIVVLAVAGITVDIVYDRYWTNFAVVEEGKLFRSAQPRVSDLEEIKANHGLKTIISLRGKEEREVKKWAKQNKVVWFAMSMNADNPPTPEQAGIFFDIMRGDTVELTNYKDVIKESTGGKRKRKKFKQFRFKYPVLIHCEGGSDRAGVMIALYRMAFQGWSAEQAQEEMKSHWHFPFMHPAQFEFLDEMDGKVTTTYGSRSLEPAGNEPEDAPEDARGDLPDEPVEKIDEMPLENEESGSDTKEE